MTSAHAPERVRASRAAVILGVELRVIRALSAAGEIPEAGLFGTTWTYDEAALWQFAPDFALRKQALLEGLKPPKTETVYVVRCGYRVKIGFTRNLAQRMHSLKTANHRELQLLAAWPGSVADEKALHEQFANLRVSGEWFALRKPIKEWLNAKLGKRVF